MKIKQNIDGKSFLSDNEDLLLRDESMNNLILGLSDSIIKGYFPDAKPLFLSILDNDKIIGQALKTNIDQPLILSDMPESGISAIVSFFFENNIEIKEIVAPARASSHFLNYWRELRSIRVLKSTRQGVFEAREIFTPHCYAGGEIFCATKENQDIVETFIKGFIEHCFPDEVDIEKKVDDLSRKHFKNKTLYLWRNEENEIVSMAAKSRESKNAATIALVFTPKKYREKGYGSFIVTELSKKILREGKNMCNLFTDLDNPVSNSIYKKIGYKYLGEYSHLTFS